MILNDDGKYTQITVKIAEDIPEKSCDTVLDNLKVNRRQPLCDLVYKDCIKYYTKQEKKATIN